MNSNRQQLNAGTLIGGRYSIVKPIGQGGMAHVYLAADQQTGGSVAVKVMKTDLSHDQEFIKRFDTEAKAASSLDHPNIVKVLSFGQDGDLRYIVQEYVDGSTLKDLIQARGALDWTLAVPLAIQIGLALEHAHKRGVVHRDIKPHNILITRDMVAKVTDFGIARALNTNTITLTSGMTFGSVQYFSPEQARGSIVSEKSDIYSLGVMLYEMVTGQVPFDGETSVAIAIKHLQEMPPLPSTIRRGIPRSLDNIILKCMQKSPDNRYLDARELVDELDSFMIEPDGVYGIVSGNTDQAGNTTAIGLKRPEPNYGKIREIEKTINDRRRSRQRDVALVIGIILLSLVFLTSVGVWAWGKFQTIITAPTDSDFLVQNYIGQSIDAVEPVLNEAKAKYGIKFEIQFKASNSVSEGQIIDQKPAAGITIKSGGTTVLFIYVSAGLETETLKDYSGKTAEAATADLKGLGFNVTYSYEASDQFEVGQVIKTFPEKNSGVAKGQTVNLVVCGGATKVKMVDLTGMTLLQVQELFTNELHLVIGTQTSLHIDPLTGLPAELPEELRIILKQSVPVDTEVTFQSVIDLTYGDAQDYINFLNPTPTPEPSPTPTPIPSPTPSPTPTEPPTETTAPSATTAGTTSSTTTIAETTKKPPHQTGGLVFPVLLTTLLLP